MDNDLISKARRKNKEFSFIEKMNGFASPEECNIISHLETALFAIRAGIKLKNFDEIAEGYCLLEDTVNRLKKNK